MLKTSAEVCVSLRTRIYLSEGSESTESNGTLRASRSGIQGSLVVRALRGMGMGHYLLPMLALLARSLVTD